MSKYKKGQREHPRDNSNGMMEIVEMMEATNGCVSCVQYETAKIVMYCVRIMCLLLRVQDCLAKND